MDLQPAYGADDPFMGKFDISDFMRSEEKCFRVLRELKWRKGPNAPTGGLRMWSGTELGNTVGDIGARVASATSTTYLNAFRGENELFCTYPRESVGYVMDVWKRKKKIVKLGMCIGFVVLLALYLGLFADGPEIPPFESRMVYSLPLDENEQVSVRNVIATDLTGDGRKEILVSYDVHSVERQTTGEDFTFAVKAKEARMLVLSSDTVGNFQKLWEYNPGLTKQTIAVGDFDGDGKLDVVVGGFKVENWDEFPLPITSRVEVLLQKEDGIFDKVFSSDIPEFLGPGHIVAGDFDGDGRTDFVVSGVARENESPYHALLFRNEGGENFTVSPIALREGITVLDMWKADINSDGSPDLIMRALDRDYETHSMILLLNNGRGEFEFQELDVPAFIVGITDFTENGYPDIIYTGAGQLGGEVYLLRNDRGGFVEPKSIYINEGRWFMRVISADFNNDNTPDVLLLEGDSTGHLLLVEETAGGELSFTRKWIYKFLGEGKSISSFYSIASTDINNDGWIDLILVCGDGGVYLALNQPRLE